MNSSYSKQKVSFYVGITVLITHIFLSIYLWFFFDGQDKVVIAEISTPLTVAYAVAVIKWIVENQGNFQSPPTVGRPYAIIISVVVVTFLGCLIAGPIYYNINLDINPESLNKFFVFVESSFGVLFSIVFSDLFQN